MFKLIITNGSENPLDIMPLIQSVTWSGNYQQCARVLEFSLVSSATDKKIPMVKCDLGNGVSFMQDNRELFSGFIFTRQKSTEGNLIDITCYDRGIYLKRNEASYKFTGMTPEAISKRICSDFGISVGNLANTGVKITRNFIGTSLYNIILTAYTLASEKTGEKYLIRFEGSKMSVVKRAVTDETLVIEGGSNLMSASVTESITEMVNQVRIYNSDDVLVGTQSDAEAIKLYGVMQSYMKQSDSEDATAKAKKLIANNGVSQKITINNLGNIANITGGTVVVREPYTGLYGLFHIDNDIHTWKNGQYYNKLTVNFKAIMDEKDVGILPNKDGKKTSDNGEPWKYINKPGGTEQWKITHLLQ